MAISFESQYKRGATTKDMLKKVLMRTFKLFMLGLMTNNGPKPLDQIRYPGVLMRFCVSYFVVSMIILFVPKNKKALEKQESKFRDLLVHIYEFIPVVLILGLWLGLTFFLPVPGCPTGYLGPGGLLGDYGKYPNCTGGAALYIDLKLFGVDHIYQSPTPQEIYLTGPFDPEGALGALTSIVMVYFGLMAGRVIVYYKTHKERITRWLIGSVILGVVSLILTGGQKNGGMIPVNKNLWSLSFITTLGCFALIILPLLYWVIDIKKIWGGSPFKAMGMNSIVLFCGSSFLYRFFPFSISLPRVNGCYNPSNDTHDWLLFKDLKNTCIWLLIANWMHYEKFYINL